MTKRRVSTRRQQLVEWIKAHGEVVEDESLKELEVLAALMERNEEPEVCEQPERKRERPWAYFRVYDPDLIAMFQGSGECIMTGAHAIRRHARTIHEHAPVEKYNGLIHVLRGKKRP